LLDIDTVLIPICAQSHWTLAVIRPGKRTVAHLDSMRGGRGDRNVKAKLLELVAFILEDQFVEAEWSAIDYEAPLQTNGWDCGVFTITNAMCLAVGLNPKSSYTEGELTLQRRRLAAMLLNEGFKGEFSLDGF
jgi:Ulp1 family protease